MTAAPIDGQTLLLAAAKASVGPRRLDELVERAQAELAPRLDGYRRRYELAHEDGDGCYFFVETGHWATVGDRLDFADREVDAVRRAHREQLRRLGRREGRDAEFEAALELRECVVVGR